MLHSLYGGMENILKRIQAVRQGASQKSETWHTRMLETSLRRETDPDAPLSKDLYVKMKDYLEFRHVFRHAYPIELQWKKMVPLAMDCMSVFEQFKSEITSFLVKTDLASR